ncbi:MAG: protease complex subunit PrcB family protein [Firmicutes bacterium]|nr:protease complex subunit PrcB family protein [Bacillota bacterium]
MHKDAGLGWNKMKKLWDRMGLLDKWRGIPMKWRITGSLALVVALLVVLSVTAFGGSEPMIEDKLDCLPDGDIPPQLLLWLDANRAQSGYNAFLVDGAIYLTVRAGEKPTGGYRVELGDLDYTDTGVKVSVEFVAPKPWDMVTQVISYPHAVIACGSAGDIPETALFVNPQGAVLATVSVEELPVGEVEDEEEGEEDGDDSEPID